MTAASAPVFETIDTGRHPAANDNPDALLLELADVGVRRLVIECRPSRSRSLYVARWRQDGRRHSVEARTLGAVLRRVLRAARAVSGD